MSAECRQVADRDDWNPKAYCATHGTSWPCAYGARTRALAHPCEAHGSPAGENCPLPGFWQGSIKASAFYVCHERVSASNGEATP